MHHLQTKDFQPEKLKTVNCVATLLPVRSFRQSVNNIISVLSLSRTFPHKILCNVIIIYNSHHTLNKQKKSYFSFLFVTKNVVTFV